jgi:hypothetical protein
MGDKQGTNWEEHLDPDKLISKRQYRMVKGICGNELYVRAESAARYVTGKNLLELDQMEAHKLIQFLDRYSGRDDGLPFREVDQELGRALISFDPRKALLNTEARVLCLLAMHRVATPGQIARFAFGLTSVDLSRARELAEGVLERMIKAGFIGRERNVGVKVASKSAKTDVYFLTEEGCDQLHQLAPYVNYYARPSISHPNRIYHDLCVLEARLDLQSRLDLNNYEPEIIILSEQQKVRNRRNGSPEVGSTMESGCGDFRGYLVDPTTGRQRSVEVEVIIRSRGSELAAKPRRITDYYAASLHRCFLIELRQNRAAKLVANVMEPLTAAEAAELAAPPAAARETVSEARLSKVRAAFDRMGGVATPEAVATIAGIKATTASEALALLVSRQEIDYCDGFPITGKTLGRNLRLYTRKGFEIHSIYEFGRLLTASKVISSGIMATEFQRAVEPVGFEATTGILLLNSSGEDWLVIAIIDDPSELACRVIKWAEAAYEQARQVVDKDRVIIATSGRNRAEELQAISRFKIIEVKTITQSASQAVQRKGRKKKKRSRKRLGSLVRHPG